MLFDGVLQVAGAYLFVHQLAEPDAFGVADFRRRFEAGLVYIAGRERAAPSVVQIQFVSHRQRVGIRANEMVVVAQLQPVAQATVGHRVKGLHLDAQVAQLIIVANVGAQGFRRGLDELAKALRRCLAHVRDHHVTRATVCRQRVKANNVAQVRALGLVVVAVVQAEPPGKTAAAILAAEHIVIGKVNHLLRHAAGVRNVIPNLFIANPDAGHAGGPELAEGILQRQAVAEAHAFLFFEHNAGGHCFFVSQELAVPDAVRRIHAHGAAQDHTHRPALGGRWDAEIAYAGSRL